MGAFLPAFTLRPKRRTIQAPKFYFRDVGVVDHLARRGKIEAGSELFGKAKDTKGLLDFKKDFPTVRYLIVVCLEKRLRKTDEGVYIVPYREFIDTLWQGKWVEER